MFIRSGVLIFVRLSLVEAALNFRSQAAAIFFRYPRGIIRQEGFYLIDRKAAVL